MCCWIIYADARPISPANGDDAADAKWVSLAELEGVGLTPDTLRVIRKAIDMASCC